MTIVFTEPAVIHIKRRSSDDRKYVDMLDGRRYFSDDKWQTIYKVRPSGKRRKVTYEQEADAVRLIAVVQS